jgi:hypothetical protein
MPVALLREAQWMFPSEKSNTGNIYKLLVRSGHRVIIMHASGVR